MVQLRELSGGGLAHEVSRFPCVVGRAAGSDVCLERPGVWDQHLRIELGSSREFLLTALPPALASVNGVAFTDGRVRNGDIIEIGAVSMEFRLVDTVQRGIRIREAFLWATILAGTLAQVGLIYWLLM